MKVIFQTSTIYFTLILSIFVLPTQAHSKSLLNACSFVIKPVEAIVSRTSPQEEVKQTTGIIALQTKMRTIYDEGAPNLSGAHTRFGQSFINFFRRITFRMSTRSLKDRLDSFNIFAGPMVRGKEKKDTLNFKGLKLTDKDIDYIVKKHKDELHKKKHIDLSNNPNLTTASIIKLLQIFPSILTLNLRGIPGIKNQEVLDHLIENSNQVSRLHLEGLNKEDLSKLLKLKKLLVLDFLGTKISSNILNNLPLVSGITTNQFNEFIQNYFSETSVKGNIKLLLRPKSNKSLRGALEELTRKYEKLSVKFEDIYRARRGLNDIDSEVIDGDTVKALSFSSIGRKYDLETFNLSFRLAYINTAETVQPSSKVEEKVGLAGKYFTQRMLERADDILAVHSGEEKYQGRLPVEIFVKINKEWFSLNDSLVIHGLAQQYHGESRIDIDWAAYYEENKSSIDFWSAGPNLKELKKIRFFETD